MIKAIGPESMNIFVKLCGNIYRTRVWPDDWPKSILLRIEKDHRLQGAMSTEPSAYLFMPRKLFSVS